LVGPITTPSGNVVTIACREDCSAASTFNGCALAPFSGLGVTTTDGKVDSGCMSFAVDRAEGLFEAATQGVTTIQQTVQGDTRGVPAGQIAAGSRQESQSRIDQQRLAVSDDVKAPVRHLETTTTTSSSFAPHPSPVPTNPPTVPGAQPCNLTTESGGSAGKSTVHQLGKPSGVFNFSYDAQTIPDRFQVIYQGNTLLDTGFVSNTATVSIPYSGTATIVTVIVTGNSNLGTAWEYTVACPV
jgi:hypothetical protein